MPSLSRVPSSLRTTGAAMAGGPVTAVTKMPRLASTRPVEAWDRCAPAAGREPGAGPRMAATDGGRPVDVTIGSLVSSAYTPGGRYRVKSGITPSQRWNPEHPLHPPWVYIAQRELHPSRLRPG